MNPDKDKKYTNEIKKAFNQETNKGRKRLLVLALSVGLIGGYTIGHYGDTRITGNVASYQGGSIKQLDFYNNLKNNTQGSGLLKTNLALATFGNTYGKKVDATDVNNALTFYERTSLMNANSSKDKKAVVKQQLAFEKGLKSEMTVSDKEMKEAYKDYKAPIQFRFLIFKDKSVADKVSQEIVSKNSVENLPEKNEIVGGNWQKLTYTNSVEYSYQDLSAMIPKEILEKVYKMSSDNAEVIKYDVIDNTGQPKTFYYVVEVVKKDKNTGNWKDYKPELKNLVQTKKAETDAKSVNKVIKKVFKENNVKVSDEYFKKALKDYLD